MMQECLSAYYNSRCRNLENAFFKAAGFFDPDGVHDLRVAVKQVRAFFRLLEWMTPAFKGKKYIRPFRALFKAAGDLRDVHVQQELSRKWSRKQGEFLGEYYNSLKEREFPARKKFADFAEHFNLPSAISVNRKRIAHTLSTFSQNALQEKLQQRISAQTTALIGLCEQALKHEARLHSLRILSKETCYTLDIATCCPVEAACWDTMRVRLRAVHQALGKWHDAEVACEQILHFQQETDTAEDPVGSEADGQSGIYQQFFQSLHAEKAIHLQRFQVAWAEYLSLSGEEDSVSS